MLRICLVLLVGLLTCTAATAKDDPCRPKRHAKVPVVEGLTYHKARKRLLAAGWRPLQTKKAADADTDPDISSGNGLEFWRRGYVEIQSCAGTGEAPCAFTFRDAFGSRLSVFTAGEESPSQHVSAKVTGSRFLCDGEE